MKLPNKIDENKLAVMQLIGTGSSELAKTINQLIDYLKERDEVIDEADYKDRLRQFYADCQKLLMTEEEQK